MSWYRFDRARGLLTLTVHAQPGAKHAGITPHGEDAIKVRINAPPIEGRANAAICELIAARLGVAKSAVQVLRGESGKRKIVEVRIAEFEPVSLCDAASDVNSK